MSAPEDERPSELSVTAALRVHLRFVRDDLTLWSADGWPGATREVGQHSLSVFMACDDPTEIQTIAGDVEGSKVVVEVMLNASRTVKTTAVVQGSQVADGGFELVLSVDNPIVAETIYRAARIVHNQPMVLRALLIGGVLMLIASVSALLWWAL